MCHTCGSAGPKDRPEPSHAQPQYTTPFGTCGASRDYRGTAEVITEFGIQGLDACVDVAFDEGNALYDAGQSAIALLKAVAARSATGQVRLEAV